MQRDRFAAAAVWLRNAAIDLALATEVVERFPSRACFHSQQAAELALKATLIALSDDHPRSHVGEMLTNEISSLGVSVPPGVITAANRLDLFYIGSRYPDALGGADPSKVLQPGDAADAIALAQTVYDFAERAIRGAPR